MRTYKAWLIGALFATMVAVPTFAQDEEPSRVLITNVNIFDGISDELAIGMSVLVTDNLISEVATAIPAPDGATIIDGGGMDGAQDQRKMRV